MIHAVQNQMNCILLTKRTRDIYFVQLRDRICSVSSECEWRVERPKMTKSNNRSNFHKKTTSCVGELSTALLL